MCQLSYLCAYWSCCMAVMVCMMLVSLEGLLPPALIVRQACSNECGAAEEHVKRRAMLYLDCGAYTSIIETQAWWPAPKEC